MTESFEFHPPRKRGLAFHIVVTLILAATSAFAVVFGINQQVGAYFILLLIISLLLIAPLPWIIYRAYALSRAAYRLERDGLRLRWGLRAEDIPLPEIEWVRRSSELVSDLHLPRLSWPGAVLGKVKTPDLGLVEFMASTADPLLLVATPQRIYAISPEDPDAFIRSFQHTFEMGSLTPLSSVSVQPAAYLSQVWSDVTANRLLAGGFLLMLLLSVSVSLAIPGRETVSLGFFADGSPRLPVPAEQLLLLPILGILIYIADLSAGLFFYQRAGYRPVAYLLWGSAIFSALLLSVAALLIL